MKFEKTRGFIDNCEEITAEGIFDLFTCVLDDAYRASGEEQVSDFPVLDKELYLKALSRVVFAINASVRENEHLLSDARESLKARISKAKEELESRDAALFSEIRHLEHGMSELNAQVEEKNLKLEALKSEREELLKWGISAGDKCRELSRDIETLTDKKGALAKEISELEARAKLLVSCWNSLCEGEQGVRILKLNQFSKIPNWFSEKTQRISKEISEMSGKFGELVLYSESLTR